MNRAQKRSQIEIETWWKGCKLGFINEGSKLMIEGSDRGWLGETMEIRERLGLEVWLEEKKKKKRLLLKESRIREIGFGAKFITT